MPHALPKPAPAGVPDDTPEAPPSVSLWNVVGSLLLSLMVLAVIGYFTFEPAAFREMLGSINPALMGMALLMVVARVFFGGWRLHFVSDNRLGLMAATRGQLAWDFASNITPSLVGGAPLAAFYIARDSRVSDGPTLTVGEVTASMIFVMVLDQIWFALSVPLVLFSALYIEAIPTSLGVVGQWTSVLYFLVFMVWTGIFAYATLYRPSLLQKIADRILRIKGLRRFRARVDREMILYQERAKILRSQPASFYLKGFLLTTGTWMARYLLLVFIIWSVFADLDVFLTFVRTAALTLGSLIMPTPGGAGGVEGLYALFLGGVMPSALVVPTLLVWRILAYYIFLTFGIFLTTHQVQKNLMHRKSASRPKDAKRPTRATSVPAPEKAPEEENV